MSNVHICILRTHIRDQAEYGLWALNMKKWKAYMKGTKTPFLVLFWPKATKSAIFCDSMMLTKSSPPTEVKSWSFFTNKMPNEGKTLPYNIVKIDEAQCVEEVQPGKICSLKCHLCHLSANVISENDMKLCCTFVPDTCSHNLKVLSPVIMRTVDKWWWWRQQNNSEQIW